MKEITEKDFEQAILKEVSIDWNNIGQANKAASSCIYPATNQSAK